MCKSNIDGYSLVLTGTYSCNYDITELDPSVKLENRK